MLERINREITRVAEFALWVGFLALMITVGLQVVARNLLGLPLIWTLDVAQLLFSWLVFVGAAIAFRRGAHYVVDIWPEDSVRLDLALRIVGAVAASVVVYVLVRYGWAMVAIRHSSEIQSLGISRAWMFLPIPLGGAVMALFLLETMVASVRTPRS